MRKQILIALIAIVLLPNLADAQRWKRFRRQIIGGVGVTNFLGDLGGGSGIGRDFVWDLDFEATRPSMMIGYRYQFNSYLFGRANLQWGILKGDDNYTTESFRSQRNLRFRTGYFELDLMAEFYLIQNARGNLYRLKGVRGRKGLKMDIYIYGGVGLMYFNPKGLDQSGQWVKLQPLGTEGQGLPGQPDRYNRITFTVPYGIGVGKSIDRYWGVNIEFTMRQTFTDYIDDVSGNYYGRQRLYEARLEEGFSRNEAARIAVLSDPSFGLGGNSSQQDKLQSADNFESAGYNRNDLVGQQRGDPTDNDAYMTGMITVSRKIVKRRRSRPKF